MSAPALLPLAGKRFNRDPHFQRVMAREEWDYLRLQIGFNRDPHFQRVMVVIPILVCRLVGGLQ